MDEERPDEREDSARLQALTDNTAQGIFNYLKDVENKREIFEKRWIWELLQNALDATPKDKRIDVRIVRDGNSLVFSHNGRPFRSEEVAHLIYHGSTKKESDIGKFGTGFLVTHLLSKRVNVGGIRDDGSSFRFLLDRSGKTADEIKVLMERTWNQYKQSLKDTMQKQAWSAEYQYTIDGASEATATQGIEILRRIAPYVLAFNNELGNITILNEGHVTKYAVIEETREDGHLGKTIEEETETEKRRRELLILAADDVEVAVEIETVVDDVRRVGNLEGVPRIFLGFPLFATEDLPYPAVINSRSFEPTERRDGIFLGKDETEYIRKNKNLVKSAIDLVVRLASDCVLSKCVNAHVFAVLVPPPQKDWLDKDWQIELLRTLADGIANLRIVRTEAAGMITLKDSSIPSLDESQVEKSERLWDLFSKFTAYEERMPARSISNEWSKILRGWKALAIECNGTIGIETVVRDIESCNNLSGLKSQLVPGTDEIDLLNECYVLLIDLNRQGALDKNPILPNQNGDFVRKPDLLRDNKIDERLKDIAKNLGKDIRSQLVHSKIVAGVQELLPGKEENAVLSEVTSLVREPKPGDDHYCEANADLFDWILQHGELKHLEGFPLLSMKKEAVVKLSSKMSDKVLAPKDIWDSRASSFADLFPQEQIVSSLYLAKVGEKDGWEKLASLGFLLLNPLFTDCVKLSEEQLERLVAGGEKLDENKEHEIIEPITVTNIAFITEEDKGILDTVRKSKEKARKFLSFLFDYVIEADNQWQGSVGVACKCGTQHKVYPSLWIDRLKGRAWVPVKKGKSEKPSAQLFGVLLMDERELLQKCTQGKSPALLNILDVSISEIMRNIAATDPQTKLNLDVAVGSLYNTFRDNPIQLAKIARLAESDLDFISRVEEQLATKEQIHRNQAVGTFVEQTLKEALEAEGMKVLRTGVGSDFAIENDFVEGDKEMLLEIKKENSESLYIEIKSTTQDSVRMTLTQAKEAKNSPGNHVLAVVKLPNTEPTLEDVRNNVRFVLDIGQIIQDKVDKAENLKDEQDKTIAETGDIEIEVNEGPIRIRIREPVWLACTSFDEFLDFVKARS